MTVVQTFPLGDFGSWIGGKLFCQASPPLLGGADRNYLSVFVTVSAQAALPWEGVGRNA